MNSPPKIATRTSIIRARTYLGMRKEGTGRMDSLAAALQPLRPWRRKWMER